MEFSLFYNEVTYSLAADFNRPLRILLYTYKLYAIENRSYNMFSAAKNKIVVFFQATNQPYSGKGINVFSFSPQKEFHTEKLETSTEFLSCSLDLDPNNILGYDGCHFHSVGLYAFGIVKSSEDLYAKLKEKIKTSKERITLILDGQSRGALSACLTAQLIQADPDLRDKVDVILNLKDPVSGNFNFTPQIDVAGITVTKQLFDLSHCTCIKSATITVQQKGDLPAAFDVVIPKFPKNTKLDIEYLPGTHMLPLGGHLSSKSNNVYSGHPGIYQLVLYKSLQIYYENDIDLNYGALFDALKGIAEYQHDHDKSLQTIDSKLGDTTAKLKQLILVTQCNFLGHIKITSVNNEFIVGYTPGFNPNKVFLQFLIDAQNIIYQSLLEEFRNDKTLLETTRDLHYGGSYGAVASDPSAANCFTVRHANIAAKASAEQTKKIPASDAEYPKPLLGFKEPTKRDDITDSSFINIPNNPLKERYQRIMMTLDQIKSNLYISKRKPRKKYLDEIKAKLASIMQSNLSIVEKQLEIECYIQTIYREVRANEGLFRSRLRVGLERIMNNDDLLGLRKRYGIYYSPCSNKNYQELCDLSIRLTNSINHHKETAEKRPDLFNLGIKFMTSLKSIYTERNAVRDELFAATKKLLKDANDMAKNEWIDELKNTYMKIRKNENKKFFSRFRSSNLGNFLENFLKNELGIKDLPHRYDETHLKGWEINKTKSL